MHFSLLQSIFLLTAECISPYCIWSLKDPAHHIPNQTEIATKEFRPKSLLRKQNEIDFIERHIQTKLSLKYKIVLLTEKTISPHRNFLLVLKIAHCPLLQQNCCLHYFCLL